MSAAPKQPGVVEPKKSAHGGARSGAGRPPAEEKKEIHQVRLPPWAAALLRAMGEGSISRGIVVALGKLHKRE